MPLTPKQVRAITYKKQRDEAARELESRATYGAVAGADLEAVHEANRSLVECWMTHAGAVICPSCAKKRPRDAFRYSADRDTDCALCHQPVGLDDADLADEHARRQADIESSHWRNS